MMAPLYKKAGVGVTVTMSLLRLLLLSAVWILAVPNLATAPQLRAEDAAKPVQLSGEHLAAAGRDRRIIINFDTISGDRRFGGP